MELLKLINQEAYQGYNYTSARLLSKGKYSMKYGKVEIRAKIPSGGGTWPALWMLGDNIDSGVACLWRNRHHGTCWKPIK